MILEDMVTFINCCNSEVMAARNLKFGRVVEKASKAVDTRDKMFSTTFCYRPQFVVDDFFVIDECFYTRRPKNLKNTKFTCLVFAKRERLN